LEQEADDAMAIIKASFTSLMREDHLDVSKSQEIA
jgi:hypothetical protein